MRPEARARRGPPGRGRRFFYERAAVKNLLRSVVLPAGCFVIYVILHNVAMLGAIRSATR